MSSGKFILGGIAESWIKLPETMKYAKPGK